MILEACVETLEECLIAKANGAHQFELCGDLSLDGLTPDFELTREVIEKTSIPTKVMIRNRGGDFCYSDEDMAMMRESILTFKKLAIAEYVFGALIKDEKNQWIIDTEKTKTICELAYPTPVTFHKAIDLCSDPVEEAKKLIQFINLKYILTSGGKPTAFDGADIIKEMQSVVYPHISVIAAGKVTDQNVDKIQAMTGVKYFHGKKIVGELVG